MNENLVWGVNEVIESIHCYLQNIVLTIIRDSDQREATG